MIVFWDIDGTLLTTDRAGVAAWGDAVDDVTGSSLDLSAIRIAGLTDYQIAAEVLVVLGVQAEASLIDALVRAYEARLPQRLPQRNGRVLPNAREILLHLHGSADVRSYLLTGNTRAGANAKLGYYGLREFFSEGAFAEDTGDRESIARRGLELARAAGPVAANGVFVIGDTPHDIRCANAIGARTLAVATGGYTVAELEPHRPWRIVPSLPEPAEFLTLLLGASS